LTTIPANDVTTHLSRLLEQVERGETVVITRDGPAIAHLVPAPASALQSDTASKIERWIEERKNITLGGLKVRDLIEEGRRSDI
jgi:prevent-host-death family protein